MDENLPSHEYSTRVIYHLKLIWSRSALNLKTILESIMAIDKSDETEMKDQKRVNFMGFHFLELTFSLDF